MSSVKEVHLFLISKEIVDEIVEDDEDEEMDEDEEEFEDEE